MAKIEVNSTSFEITKSNEGLLIDGKQANYDIIELPNGEFNLLFDNQSFTIAVEEKNASTGALRIRLNGRSVETKLQNKLAALLKSMGMESDKKKLKELKAPMPGLVLDVLVKSGNTVTIGQDLLILEAMKMENSIKSPQDGVIDEISIQKQDKVEKNQILLSFE